MNLPQVKEDFKAGLEGSIFLGSDTYGDKEEKQFIVNKDLDNYSIRSLDMAKYNTGLSKMFKSSPNKKFFGLFLHAGHGMMRDGVQCFVLNQF